MTQKRILTLAECGLAASALSAKLQLDSSALIYGVPRGGIVPAYMVAAVCGGTVTENLNEATVVIDDLVRTGKTLDRIINNFWSTQIPLPGALFDKSADHQYECGMVMDPLTWLVFPWEVNGAELSKTDIVERMLEAIGEDSARQGLIETPARVVKAWDEWFSGYGKNPADVLKQFEDGAEGYDEMIMQIDLPFYSFCEHHMAPFFGTATIGYIPNGKIVGLSKLPRLIEIFSRRLQVQERLTRQIADAIEEVLQPLGVGVVTKARHLCMESRGICKQGHHAEMSAMRGAMKDNATTRAEFFALANGK